jgi:hypothetical protein
MRGLALLAAVAVLGACTEDLETKAACPSLCPNQDVTLRDTIVSAVVLDTTLSNYPGKGAESFLFVASQGSVLDTRAVVRFDSLLRKFDRSATDTGVAITSVTRARVRFSVDTTNSVLTAPFTVNVYDVDTPAVDPSDAAVLAAFDAGQLLGSVTFASKSAILGDTISIPLDPAKVAEKITGGKRIRVGVRVASSAPARLRLYATSGSTAGLTPALFYDPTDSTDAIAPLVVTTASFAPAASTTLEFNARDYTIAAVGGAGPVASDEIAVGALPARRVYMRFAIPSYILDSTTIVRAQLILSQRPAPNVGSSSVSLVPMLGIAGRDVTDPARAALIAIGPEVASLGLTAVALDPTASGLRTVEVGSIVRGWRASLYDTTPRAMVLRVGNEGYEPGELRFYSSEAADPNVRPRLSITYVPQVTFGLP